MAGFFNARSMDKSCQGRPQKISQCGKCGLMKDCISPKMGVYGKGEKKILFIGEVPGEEEDRQGLPFVGKSGQLFRKILKELGVDLDDCLYTNAICCKPPKGKVEPYMVQACRPSVINHLQQLKPHIIVLMGQVPLESILGGLNAELDTGSIQTWTGWAIPVEKYNCWVCPTYHPSSLWRREKEDTQLRNIFKKHLKKAISLEEKTPTYLPIQELTDSVEIIRSKGKAERYLRQLEKESGILAFDYETSGLKPDSKKQRIVSVSFCLDGERTFAFMYHPDMADALRNVLTSSLTKKVASNLKFEERWTQEKLGVPVKRWWWDTMLAAHCIDNRPGITSIKFQAFIHLGVVDYSSHISPYLKGKTSNGLNRIDELDERELLLYNGMDSLVEYKVMEIQRKLFNAPL